MSIDGLDELDRNIFDLVTKIGGASLERMTEIAGNEVLQEVANRAPVRTGKLKASIETVIRAREHRATSSVQVANSKKGGIEFYAVFIEFGTSKYPAHPFVRPAFDASQDRAVAAFMAELKRTIGT